MLERAFLGVQESAAAAFVSSEISGQNAVRLLTVFLMANGKEHRWPRKRPWIRAGAS